MVMIEILQDGKVHYCGVTSNLAVMTMVQDREVPDRPEECPDFLYELLVETWVYEPESRPKFLELSAQFDVMQTMPAFVYLIPVVMLLGIGKIPGLIAVVIYAIPPVIRLINLGIRLVDREVLEAATAFGASSRQRLFDVQLPLAMPTIMAGINQTIMMALSMVVIASMIGVKGLGQPVLKSITNQYFTLGLLNGFAIVALAILFDRATQAYAKRSQAHLGDNKND